jgi:hypothetical protein
MRGTFSRTQVISHILDECQNLGGQAAFADKHGVSKSYLNDCLNGRRKPGKKILEAAGFIALELYGTTKGQPK